MTTLTPPEWVSFPSSVGFRGCTASRAYGSFYGQIASGTSDADRLAQIIHGCKAVALLSCTEFESESTFISRAHRKASNSGRFTLIGETEKLEWNLGRKRLLKYYLLIKWVIYIKTNLTKITDHAQSKPLRYNRVGLVKFNNV